MLRRTNLLRVVGGTTWIWQKQDLRTVYIAAQRSVAEYAAAAWTTWLSSFNIEKLERTQIQAARAITHHVRTTPTEALLHEADLPRLEHRFKTLSVLQANKWNSLDVEDPRRVVLNEAWGYGFVDQSGAPLFLRPCQAWAYWRTIRGITHHQDLSHLGAVHHQLPRRWQMFPSQCRGTSS